MQGQTLTEKRKAVFLDRDGTVMVDTGYCHEPDKVKLIEGAAEGLRLLSDDGFFLVIITNQSGVGRGYFGEKDVVAVSTRLHEEFRARGADFDALFYCPHHPLDECDCRKPRPGLILRAASEHNLDLHSSFTMGDQESDVEAGRYAGTRTVLISEQGRSSVLADFHAKTLIEAAQLILGSRVTNIVKGGTTLVNSHRLD